MDFLFMDVQFFIRIAFHPYLLLLTRMWFLSPIRWNYIITAVVSCYSYGILWKFPFAPVPLFIIIIIIFYFRFRAGRGWKVGVWWKGGD
jgi:hypothetical protein